MPDNDQPHTDETQTNISGAGLEGDGPGRKTDEGPGAETRSFQTKPGDVEATDQSSEDGRRYDPSPVESTRVRMQGGGMGAQDLDQQGDPASIADPAAGADATENNMSQTPDPRNARS